MATYYQLQCSWDCDLFDKRGDKLPSKIVVDAEKIPGFDYAMSVKDTKRFPTAHCDALRDCFADWLESKYGFNLWGLSFCPVRSRRGIDMI